MKAAETTADACMKVNVTILSSVLGTLVSSKPNDLNETQITTVAKP